MKTHKFCAFCAALIFAQTLPPRASATTMDISLEQTGGFYADGGLDNAPTFQNYFIGYGSTPGFPRTMERRHFFIFDLTGVTIPIISADLKLILPIGGLIADEPMETWVATGTSVPAMTFMDTGLTTTEAMPIFAEMGSAPEIIDPVDFGPGDDDGTEKSFALNSAGIMFLNDHLGGMVALSGYMASFSAEPEADEPDELIFAHSNVVGDAVALIDPPVLSITLVPEPSSIMLLGLGGLAFFQRKR